MDISIVIPLLNEQDSLKELYQQISTTLSKMNRSWEIIFIDDGSRDQSFKILSELHTADNRVKIIQFRRNGGKAVALSAGFQLTSGEYVITMDADLQDDPAEIPHLISKLEEGYDLVSGWKKKRYDPISKTLPSKLFNWSVSKMAGVRLHDFNCGLKAYREDVTKTVKLYGHLHRFIPVLAHEEGFRVAEIPVQHHPRKYGKTKYGASRLVSGFLDFLTVAFLAKFKRGPLHLFGFAGLFTFLIGLGITLYLAYERIFYSIYLSKRPILFLGTLLIIVGVQFVSIGLLGEMITETQKEHQNISIRKKIGFD